MGSYNTYSLPKKKISLPALFVPRVGVATVGRPNRRLRKEHFIGATAGMLAIFALAIWTTAWPANQIAKGLLTSGVSVGPIRGSLLTGFEVASVSGSIDQLEFNAYRVRIKPSGFFALYFGSKIISDRMEIDQLTLRADIVDPNREPNGLGRGRIKMGKANLPTLKVENVWVKNLRLKYGPLEEAISVGQAAAAQLSYDGRKIEIAKGQIQSPHGMAEVKNSVYFPSDRSGYFTLTGLLKRSAAENLARDVKFSVDASFVNGVSDRVQADLMGGVVKIRQKQGAKLSVLPSQQALRLMTRNATKSPALSYLNSEAEFPDLGKLVYLSLNRPLKVSAPTEAPVLIAKANVRATRQPASIKRKPIIRPKKLPAKARRTAGN